MPIYTPAEDGTSTAPSTVNYKFVGHIVQVPLHFSEGQALTALEARFANRQLASTVGNVFASAIKRLVAAKQTEADALDDDAYDAAGYSRDEAGNRIPLDSTAIDEATAQSTFNSIYDGYEIGANNNRGDGTAKEHDPVEAIARNMAWEMVKGLLKKANRKVNSVKADKKNELVDAYLEKFPAIRLGAQAQWDAAQAADVSDVDFDLGEEAPEPEAEGEGEGDAPADDTPGLDIEDGSGESAEEAPASGKKGK